MLAQCRSRSIRQCGCRSWRSTCAVRRASCATPAPRILITVPEGRSVAALLKAQVGSLTAIESVAELSPRGAVAAGLPITHEASTALIQYTSGSTGDPKGVVLSHGNLLANIRAMGHAMGASSADIFVSWLPLYHDMGLIGAWLGCLYFAAPLYVMSPLSFLVRPESWLWAIHRLRATLSAAPNFAFELCLNKIGDESLQGLDLSSLRMVANGAEPSQRPDTAPVHRTVRPLWLPAGSDGPSLRSC